MVLPVLLGVKRHGGTLEVLVDLDPESASTGEPSLLTLTFSGCDRTEEARTELDRTEQALADGIGLIIKWWMASWDDTQSTMVFCVNYGVDWLEVTFEAASEHREHPTLAHVHQRVVRLAESMEGLGQRYERLRRQHEQIVAALEQEARREADVGARKLPFLRARGSALAEAVIARTAVYERVLEIIHQEALSSDQI